MKYYAIGDIHGCFSLLEQLMGKIQEHASKHGDIYTIVFLGDYIDRGEENLKTLDFLMSLKDTDEIKYVFLRGNHEEMFIKCTVPYYDMGYYHMWISNGGDKVIDELNPKTPDDLQEKAKTYRDWMLNSTVTRFETDRIFFCHAGVDPDLPFNLQSDHWLMWNGRYTPDFYANCKKVIVHGHLVSERPIMDRRRIGIDLGSFCYNNLGAVYLDEENLGGLEIIKVV